MVNVLFVTFDSLRWDVFEAAHVPFLKSLGAWKKAYTQGTFTLPAHMAFYMGKLPQAVDGTDYYDSSPTRILPDGRLTRRTQLWGLVGTEASRFQHPGRTLLQGESIIHGYRKRGYLTLGTGAVNWFNPQTPAGRHLSRPFHRFRFFAEDGFSFRESAPSQVAWVEKESRRSRRFFRRRPVFAFVNFGETHHPFTYRGCSWDRTSNPYGNQKSCLERQQRCFEYLDAYAERLVSALEPCDLVLCADHGEALGEDGLWGHGFFHRKVMEVPLLIRPAKKPVPVTEEGM